MSASVAIRDRRPGAVLLFLVIGLSACTSGGSSAACGVAGRERSCECPKGTVGIQACGFDGTWAECTCYVKTAPASGQAGVTDVGSAAVGAAGQPAAGTDAAGSAADMNEGGTGADSAGRGGSFAAAGRGWFVPPFLAGRGGLRGAAGVDEPARGP